MILKKGYSKCVDWYLFGILFYEMHFGNSPFLSENKDDLFKNILEKNVHFFPDYISKEC
jgi:serine/threonine protein kinase